jgi:hypothetical protein
MRFLLGYESLRRPSRAQRNVELLSGGFHPRLIYNAAAAAKTGNCALLQEPSALGRALLGRLIHQRVVLVRPLAIHFTPATIAGCAILSEASFRTSWICWSQ